MTHKDCYILPLRERDTSNDKPIPDKGVYVNENKHIFINGKKVDVGCYLKKDGVKYHVIDGTYGEERTYRLELVKDFGAKDFDGFEVCQKEE